MASSKEQQLTTSDGFSLTEEQRLLFSLDDMSDLRRSVVERLIEIALRVDEQEGNRQPVATIAMSFASHLIAHSDPVEAGRSPAIEEANQFIDLLARALTWWMSVFPETNGLTITGAVPQVDGEHQDALAFAMAVSFGDRISRVMWRHITAGERELHNTIGQPDYDYTVHEDASREELDRIANSTPPAVDGFEIF